MNLPDDVPSNAGWAHHKATCLSTHGATGHACASIAYPSLQQQREACLQLPGRGAHSWEGLVPDIRWRPGNAFTPTRSIRRRTVPALHGFPGKVLRIYERRGNTAALWTCIVGMHVAYSCSPSIGVVCVPERD